MSIPRLPLWSRGPIRLFVGIALSSIIGHLVEAQACASSGWQSETSPRREAVRAEAERSVDDAGSPTESAADQALHETDGVLAHNAIKPLARRYKLDRDLLLRYYHVRISPTRQQRLRQFGLGWLAALAQLETDHWSDAERREFHQLRAAVLQHLSEEESAAALALELQPLLPFRDPIVALAEERQAVEPMVPEGAARQVDQIDRLVLDLMKAYGPGGESAGLLQAVPKSLLQQASAETMELRRVLAAWFDFYNTYDPGFTWWVRQPYASANEHLESYARLLNDLADAQPVGESSPNGNGDEAISEETWSLPSMSPPPVEWTASREPLIEADPDLNELLSLPPNRLEPILARYVAETTRGGRGRGSRGRVELDTQAAERWLETFEALDFDSFNTAERVDYLMATHQLRCRIKASQLPAFDLKEVAGPAGITGRPIGRDALLLELEREMICYTPEELVEIALHELAWCRSELIAASRELGYGDDWKRAVEHVKSQYVDPGDQPRLVRALSDEAVSFIRERGLLTIPPLANETWRMRMMPLDQQLITPFFTGGEVVSVGYPTHEMEHHAKLQSLRGNNIPFSRATVHHELIPGHGLQQFMSARYRSYRGPFSTPFWTEGWALYWEMRLYDQGFASTAEDRIGFMVWRSHRCARIVFSLGFHLGQMTPQECVDYLVDNVGFERMGAEGEVRRSFGGMYPPLYQAAYMVGGLQFRALHGELVGSGRFSEREFHDQILRQGRIPVEMVRLLLRDEPPPRDYQPNWKFSDSPAGN